MISLLARIAIFIFTALIPVVASAQDSVDRDLETLVRWVQGTYSNQMQIDSGELDADTDLLFPIFKKIDVPAFGKHVIYLQWPIGAPDGRLQRQRIWSFARGPNGLTMDFFTLKEPEQWLNAHLNPDKVRGMTRDDVIAYPKTCLLPVTREGDMFVMRIPSTCTIVSQGTATTMTLESETTITKNKMTYREAGYRPDGTRVFKVPGKAQYDFRKLKTE